MSVNLAPTFPVPNFLVFAGRNDIDIFTVPPQCKQKEKLETASISIYHPFAFYLWISCCRVRYQISRNAFQSRCSWIHLSKNQERTTRYAGQIHLMTLEGTWEFQDTGKWITGKHPPPFQIASMKKGRSIITSTTVISFLLPPCSMSVISRTISIWNYFFFSFLSYFCFFSNLKIGPLTLWFCLEYVNDGYNNYRGTSSSPFARWPHADR